MEFSHELGNEILIELLDNAGSFFAHTVVSDPTSASSNRHRVSCLVSSLSQSKLVSSDALAFSSLRLALDDGYQKQLFLDRVRSEWRSPELLQQHRQHYFLGLNLHSRTARKCLHLRLRRDAAKVWLEWSVDKLEWLSADGFDSSEFPPGPYEISLVSLNGISTFDNLNAN